MCILGPPSSVVKAHVLLPDFASFEFCVRHQNKASLWFLRLLLTFLKRRISNVNFCFCFATWLRRAKRSATYLPSWMIHAWQWRCCQWLLLASFLTHLADSTYAIEALHWKSSSCRYLYRQKSSLRKPIRVLRFHQASSPLQHLAALASWASPSSFALISSYSPIPVTLWLFSANYVTLSRCYQGWA